MLEHDLGVGAHVHQHHGIGASKPLVQRHKGGCGIAPYMACDQGQPIDPRLPVGAEAKSPGQRRQRGIGSLAGKEGVLDG